MNTLALAQAAARLAEIAHAAVDQPHRYAERLELAKRELLALLQSPHL